MRLLYSLLISVFFASSLFSLTARTSGSVILTTSNSNSECIYYKEHLIPEPDWTYNYMNIHSGSYHCDGLLFVADWVCFDGRYSVYENELDTLQMTGCSKTIPVCAENEIFDIATESCISDCDESDPLSDCDGDGIPNIDDDDADSDGDGETNGEDLDDDGDNIPDINDEDHSDYDFEDPNSDPDNDGLINAEDDYPLDPSNSGMVECPL